MGASTYVPAPTNVAVAVAPSLVAAQANVAYTLSAGGGSDSGGPLNLTIDNLYITQAVQTFLGDVPLVAGRDGLVRVFVKANTNNTAQPQVRVRLFNGSTLIQTLTVNPPTSAVPTVVSDATLNSAWYAIVPGASIQPGLRVLAEVDPGNSVAEASESDNTWPASGTAAALVVKNVATFSVRFVPVRQSNNYTGNVSAANTAAFLADMRRMYPLAAIDADVRATYTTNAPVLQANDMNNAWNTVLSEVNALRALDGSSRHYYGVVKTTYSSGVAGMGYLGAPAAIGWDHLPSGADVMAHEMGHNWGRYHAPCGGAGSPDPSFPYVGGKIGVSGFDLTSSLFKPPSLADLMGYCSSPWVSDYTYKGILNYREAHALAMSAAAMRKPEPSVLLWGRIGDGEVVLEPAFDVVAPARFPEKVGPHRLEALAEDGSVLLALAFDGESVDHSTNQQHFAFVVPQSALRGKEIAALRLSARGRSAELRSRGSRDAAAVRVMRTRTTSADVTWSDSNIRGVLVRDARSGDILTFARSGRALVHNAGDSLDLVISDGVRSRATRVSVK
jgi:hypothetical protein